MRDSEASEGAALEVVKLPVPRWKSANGNLVTLYEVFPLVQLLEYFIGKKMPHTPGCLVRKLGIRDDTLLLILVLLVTAVAIKPAEGQENNFRTAFLSDYEPHAKRLKEHYSNVLVEFTRIYHQGDGNIQVTDATGKITERDYVVTVTRDRVISEKTGNVLSEFGLSVEALNPYYSFALGISDGKEPKLSDLKFRNSVPLLRVSEFCFPFMFNARSQTYLELAQDEKIRIVGYRNTIWENKNTKELSVEYDYHSTDRKRDVTVKVSCYFLPDAGWVCCGVASKETRHVYTYKDAKPDNLPTPLKAESFFGAQVAFTTSITEFRRVAAFDDADFRLTAFGLPEPMGVPPINRGGIRWYVWICAAAFGAIAAAVGMRTLKRGYEARKANPVGDRSA